MARPSEQLEREAEEARRDLAASLDELRGRMTPGQIVDEVSSYARHTAAADFVGNLGRELRENPLPLLLIAAGIGWAAIATARSQRNRQALVPAEAHPVEVWHPEPAATDRSWEVTAVTPAGK